MGKGMHANVYFPMDFQPILICCSFVTQAVDDTLTRTGLLHNKSQAVVKRQPFCNCFVLVSQAAYQPKVKSEWVADK